jgi:hypothetical protein
MKKPEIKFDLRKLQKDSQNTSWQKAVLGALLLSLAIFSAASIYLFFMPTSDSIRQAIDTETNEKQVNFKFKTLEKLKSRQTPNAPIQAPSGKNPFTPF